MFQMYNPYWTQFIVDKPPTVYSLLESIVNYGKDDKTKIKDLAKEGRTTFFNFDYPLTNKISKEDFETMILNHFIDRRIGYETLTTFRIKLNVKLNEIMPVYNKMFEMLDGWSIFEDGETTQRTVSDTRNINTSNRQDIDGTTTNNEDIDGTVTISNNTTTSTQNSSQTTVNNTNDIRKSDTPQNELQDVRDGSYVTDYEYRTDNSTGTDSSTGSGSSINTGSNVEDKTVNVTNIEDKTIQNTGTSTNTGSLQETVNKTPADKLKLYTEFIEKRKHIYTMIFDELECLFYQLV